MLATRRECRGRRPPALSLRAIAESHSLFDQIVKDRVGRNVTSASSWPWSSPDLPEQDYTTKVDGPLYRILTEYLDYYHNVRCHLALDRNSPTPRVAEPPSRGKVVSIPQVGGLHHRYTRAA